MKSSFELLCCLPLVVMNSDEQFSDNVDKQMLIQLVNENVIPKSFLKNLETPEKSTSLAFFFSLILANK